MAYSLFSTRKGKIATLTRKSNVPRYVGTSTSNSIGPVSAQLVQTTIGSTATIANCEACYNAIYAAALALGFSDAQAAAIAAAATLAYAAAVNQGLSQTQGQQAASAAAVQVALADDPGYGGPGLLGLLDGEVALAAAFGSFMGLVPVSNQAAATAAWLLLLQVLGIES